MIQSQQSASRPRNSRPVAPRRQPAVRRSAASRPDLADGGRWKVQLELAPAEIAFVYRRGLARGAEVCRRGTHEWRPLLTTPELHDALSARASLAEMIEVAPPAGSALTLSQTLAISDPSLAALFLAQRSTQLPKSTPPPPPPAVTKSSPPPPLVAHAMLPPPLDEPRTLPVLARPTPLVNRDSVPDWEDTPLLPLRIEPAPLPRHITLPSARLLAERSADPVVVHARPVELSLAAAAAVLLTLVITALTLRAEAPKLTALISSSARPARAEPRRASFSAASKVAAPSTIPVVFWHDLPVEGGRAAGSVSNASSSPSRVAGMTRSASGAEPNRAALARALGGAAAAAQSCGEGPVNAQVVVTFGPSGVARNIHFASAPPVALRSCVLNAVARTHIAPFDGEAITVSKTLRW